MTTVELTDDTFEKTITAPGIVFVDFWAPWCGPCRAFAPVYEKVAEKNADITFAKVNTEDQPETAAAFNISAIPTLMIFRDGIPLFAQPGMLPESALNTLIAKAKELDMDEVRAEIEKQRAEAASGDDAPTDRTLN